jgi:hypothetical protein
MIRNSSHWSQGLFLIGVGVLVGAFSTASCGGGSGEGNAGTPLNPQSVQITAGDGLEAAPSNPISNTGTLSVDFFGTGSAISASRSDHNHDTAYSNVKTHISTITGPITIPTTGPFTVRSVTFTPNNPKDVLIYVVLEGTVTTNNIIQPGYLYLYDANDNEIWREGASVTNPGSSSPFTKIISLACNHNTNDSVTGWPHEYPSNSYKIIWVLYPNANTVGQVDTVQFKFITLEGVKEVIDSGTITEN